jgi:hypothetical protein
MSGEGVRLVSRAALLVVVILLTAAFRTMVGPSRQRGRIVAAGTVGGLALGVFVSAPLSRWLGAETSAIAATMGMIVGWSISWMFARQIPREAP